MAVFGFIGTGNMGGALAEAVCRRVGPESVLVSNRTREKAEKLAAELGCTVADNRTAAQKSDFLFLGVKPQMMREVLEDIKGALEARRGDVVLVSMAAGLTAESISDMAGGDFAVIRIMPNTPVQVGAGMILYTANGRTSEEQINVFADAMREAGALDRIDESIIDAGSAVSGCGPAFAYMFMEALAMGGVECGLSAEQAREYAVQTVLGAAKLAASSSKTLERLRQDVCSPGGSTIEGVRVFEAKGLFETGKAAVEASFRRTKELGK